MKEGGNEGEGSKEDGWIERRGERERDYETDRGMTDEEGGRRKARRMRVREKEGISSPLRDDKAS